MESHYETNNEMNDADFLPLFLASNEKQKHNILEVPSPTKEKRNQ